MGLSGSGVPTVGIKMKLSITVEYFRMVIHAKESKCKIPQINSNKIYLLNKH